MNFIDVPMDSLPNLGGASCTSGGILRGNALGNVLNFGDAQDLQLDPSPVPGTVRIYTNGGNISSKPTMVMKTPAFSTLGPVLRKLQRKYSPVSCESIILSQQIS
jgi:hypothetical protein